MKPLTLRCMAGTAAAVAALWCWYLLTMEPDASPRSLGKALTSPALVTGNGAAVKPLLPWPKYRSDKFYATLAERGEQWLNARGRDAEGLVILFDLTHDDKLLDEALERFPDDPGVCRALVQGGRGPAKQWIERLLAADPNNPDVLYLKAWTVFRGTWDSLPVRWHFPTASGDNPGPLDSAGAIAALREASATSGPRNDLVAERINAVHDTALALGIGPGDAVRMALRSSPGFPATDHMLSYIMKAVTEERANAKAAGNEAGYLKLTTLGLDTLNKFAEQSSAGFNGELEIERQRAALLAEVPDNTDLKPFSDVVPVGVEKQIIEERLKRLEEFVQKQEDIARLLETASDQVMESYFDNYLAFGWEVADPWLLKQAEEAQ